MDAFSWIILLALGACVLLHLVGHGHGHDHGGQPGRHESEGQSADAAGSAADREKVAPASGHRHAGGCH